MPLELASRANQTLRGAFASGKTRLIEWRKTQLRAIVTLIKENRDEIIKAIGADLGQPIKELLNVLEVGSTIQEAEFAISHIDQWVKPEGLSVDLMFKPGSAFIHREPFGVVLIISPWNYPFRLLFLPLIGALAAGNAVLLKPSEVSANTSAVIKRLCDKYLDKEAVITLEGGVDISQAILKQPFDYIFYTGNTDVGKIVMRAAAEHLTPVTLELGGKSPVYVDASANLDVTVNRIAWGKTLNNGQTCIAPDYILVHKSVKDAFVKKISERLASWYGSNPETNSNYSRIITARHAARLAAMINESKQHVVAGGQSNPEKRYVQPTLILEPSPSSRVMTEEIFGPLLPIIGVDNVDEAIAFINSKEKPLALYVFTSDDKIAQKVMNSTSSGGMLVNHVILHNALNAPFGGVGPSGMGFYNKKYSFDTFSHKRTVLKKGTWPDPDIFYPPYDERKRGILGSVADGVKLPVPLMVAGAAVVAGGAIFIASRL